MRSGSSAATIGLALGAAEHQDPVEGPQGGFALARQLGDERGPRADEPGVGEVEDRPQVAEAVLDRRAGEGEPGAGRDAAQLLRGLVGRVLDGLGLVEDDAVPGQLGQRLDVAHRGAVGGDDEVGAGHLGLELLGRRAGGAVVHDDPEVGREPGRFGRPVADDGRRGDHQCRAVARGGRGGRARSASCPGPCRGRGSRRARRRRGTRASRGPRPGSCAARRRNPWAW